MSSSTAKEQPRIRLLTRETPEELAKQPELSSKPLARIDCSPDRKQHLDEAHKHVETMREIVTAGLSSQHITMGGGWTKLTDALLQPMRSQQDNSMRDTLAASLFQLHSRHAGRYPSQRWDAVGSDRVYWVSTLKG